MDDAYSQALTTLREATTIAVLTGAGVSTSSGIPDFQTLDREWPFPAPRSEMLSLSYFHSKPKLFWEAFRAVFMGHGPLVPTAFHRAVAGLEDMGKEVVVLTQNVDGLHQLAGSSQVGELHGTLTEVECSRKYCDYRGPMSEVENDPLPLCPKDGKKLKPAVVLFEERPLLIGDAKAVCIQADLLVVAGTALNVGPVNDLPAKRMLFTEKPSWWMNRDTPPQEYDFSYSLLGELDQVALIFTPEELYPALPSL